MEVLTISRVKSYVKQGKTVTFVGGIHTKKTEITTGLLKGKFKTTDVAYGCNIEDDVTSEISEGMRVKAELTTEVLISANEKEGRKATYEMNIIDVADDEDDAA